MTSEVVWHADASSWWSGDAAAAAAGVGGGGSSSSNGGSWRPTAVAVTARGLAMIVTPPSGDAVHRTISFRDVTAVAKDVSWWILPDAITLTLTSGRKEYLAGLAAQQDAFAVIYHFWNGWWAVVNALRLLGEDRTLNESAALTTTQRLASEQEQNLRRLDEAFSAGIAAASELHHQTEQLHRVDNKADILATELQQSQKLLDSMWSWWYVPSKRATSSKQASLPPSSSTITEVRSHHGSHGSGEAHPGQRMIQAETQGEFLVVRVTTAGRYQLCVLTCNNGGVHLRDDTASTSSANEIIRLGEVANIVTDFDKSQLAISGVGGRTFTILSARLRSLVPHLQKWLPDLAIAGTDTRRPAPKVWGGENEAAAIARPVAVTWSYVATKASSATSDNYGQPDDVQQQQLRMREQVPSTDAYLRQVSAKLDDLNKLATALGSVLDENLEVIDRIETKVDQTSQSLEQQTRQAKRIIKSL